MFALIATGALSNAVEAPKIQSAKGNELQLIQNNSIVAVSIPVASESGLKLVLGDIVGKTIIDTSSMKSWLKIVVSEADVNKGITENDKDKLLSICNCESSFNEGAVCYAGYKSGMGLCGFIPSTWNYVLGIMNKNETYKIKMPDKCYVEFTEYDKTHPVFDAECNYLMAMWLFKNEGDYHWTSSKSCWGI